MRCVIGMFLAFFFFTATSRGQEPLDVKLKIVPIDAAKDRLLSVRVDTMGRVFLGGDDALHVCEPDKHGGYQPRKLLYRFPERTWINDIEVRGDDLYVLTLECWCMCFKGGVCKRDGHVAAQAGVGRAGRLAGGRLSAWRGGRKAISISAAGGQQSREGRSGYWTFFG